MTPIEELNRNIDELSKMKERADKIYRDMLKLYANEPVNTPIRNRAYDAIWILARVLGYKNDKVEKDMHKAEKETGEENE